MINNEHIRQWLADMVARGEAPPTGNALPVQILQADDIANTVAWLVSDQARYITGVTLPVDAGCVNKR
jgi:NAD(P)-dependent dehydrogenase (short-subunit alcohol dehydrogenase family)